ncbi:MAG: sulfatase-like hydrolase/transferase, partial [Halieaceae bacterium]|nr:sulfatase-like hydrolase/transferase [Halieaceae bacterium]
MKKVAIFGLSLVLLLAGLAYINQIPLMLALVKIQSSIAYEVGPPRDLPWSEGPAHASDEPDERPPNIILIVADDLGYNDISTFGRGPAGGRVQTPHIDQLAAEGAVFTQSYSGAATCAVSRAMLMTGRYPTRTGFAFTPMPAGMAPIGMRITASMGRKGPSSIYYPEIDEIKPPYEEQGLPTEEVTVAEVLRDRGYQTFHIGKWHLGRK